MTEPVKLGFEMEGHVLRIDAILPGKVMEKCLTKSTKYAAILASIREIGIIEPPVVYPVDRDAGSGDGARYLLLDGHTRLEALREIGESEVFCLIATDDEAYTYNNKVNRIPPIQEHFMILKASGRGVSDERIARALKVDVLNIRRKRDMLRDICDDAVGLLKNTPISAEALRQLRRVKPLRQVEIAEMMNMVANYGMHTAGRWLRRHPRI